MPDPFPSARPRAARLVPACLLVALTGTLAGALAGHPALAQVVTNESALSGLGPAPAAHTAHPAPAHPRTGPAPHGPHAARPSSGTPAPAVAKTTAAHPPPTPTIPAAPPPPPIIRPPEISVPLHPSPPPPETPVVPTAQGTVRDLRGGTRLTFAPGSADMNAAMIDRVKTFAAALLAAPEARGQVDAYASGTPDDASTPRRVSLSRGLAIRSILIHAGVASTRIYVRAIGLSGPPPDDAAPDHVDVTLSNVIASAPPAPTELRPNP
ncbi:hypothetical protein AA13595_2953 [Gluconacetobacter johannae DSM 13595]|uniref:OmpA-like domain-containing protein n=1 Tax=Gluconacetobacter johannae TaxID=112140 RepID=A0A7W4J7R8_9PROT|nr:OmpA family protein [Gluconacetobacter johannae]MBB2176260.1 hypothetical protein [Gluconacetobacter johannae]GBQ90685.1 hypothetical protein AA13595_2953 [Gluconacetobacter johannae DSM 13595]